MPILELLRSLHREDSGQDLVEYALVLAAVAFAVVASSGSLASLLSNAMSLINSKIQAGIGLLS